MDRTERFYKIERLLRERKVVPRHVFLDELEVSLATFKRDLEYLRERLHAPIEWNADLGGYQFGKAKGVGPAYELPGLWFSADELVALLTMDRLLADLEPGVLSEVIGPFRRRIKGLLASGELSAEQVANRIRVLAMGARAIEPANFRTIATALLSRRRIRIRHNRRQDGDVLEREISPQRLVHYRDNWYVDAWCHKRQALRTFAVDAIEQATVLDKDAKDVGEESLERHFASGYGIFAGVDTQEAVLLFNAARARWVCRETWHPKQDGKLQLDGAYLLKFPYSREPELVMDILKYGADVEVLAPESLRAAVAGAHEAAALLYRRGRSAEKMP